MTESLAQKLFAGGKSSGGVKQTPKEIQKAKEKKRRRMRNKMARKSRRINRMKKK